MVKSPILVASLLLTFLSGCSEDRKPTPLAFSDTTHMLNQTTPYSLSSGERRKYDYGPLWLDLNGDNALDLIFMNHGWAPPSFYVNMDDGGFVYRASVTGIKVSNWEYPQQADRHGGSCGDFDNDGDVDLFIGHGAMRGETLGIKFDELLRNEGSLQFRDVTQQTGTLNSNGRGRAGSWMDYDNDGWLDLYVGNFDSTNVMYRNKGDGTFSDVTEETGLGVQGPRTAWLDYDLDDNIDVLVAWPLTLLRNDGNGGFMDVTRASGLNKSIVYGPYTLALGDFDNDGDIDVFVGSLKFPGKLLMNRNGRFDVLEVGHEWGFEADTTGNGANWGDTDNDGDLDLIVTRADRILLFENRGGTDFKRHDIPLSYSINIEHGGDIALGDYDGDGYLDAAIDTLDKHLLLHNDGSGRAWLKLEFEGTHSNRMGFGTKVWATAKQADGSSLRLYREYIGDSGVFRSMGCGPLHLGLGSAQYVDLRIRWLSGTERTIAKVKTNRSIAVVEPE